MMHLVPVLVGHLKETYTRQLSGTESSSSSSASNSNNTETPLSGSDTDKPDSCFVVPYTKVEGEYVIVFRGIA